MPEKNKKNDQTGMKRGLTRYGDTAFSLFLRKAFIKAMGYTEDSLSRPVIGIVDTYSGYNACHANVPDIIEAVKRGVMLAGGLPVTFPVISLHESFSYPTSMYLRNLMSMDVEEMIKAQPMDAVVLIGGCDKTVPALLMGAFSADRPAILEVTGPMMAGSMRGERIGACTDCRRLWGMHRAGEIDEDGIEAASERLVPSAGTCGVMGTASTMALMSEAMGIMLPGGAAIPAVMSDRMRHAEVTGARAVAMAGEGTAPSQLMTQKHIDNALTVLQAIGGSTNAIVHTAAIAGRLGLDASLSRLDEIGRKTPVLVDLKPAGSNYMEDLYKAGGLAPVLREIKDLLHLDAMTVSGKTLGENLDAAEPAFTQHIVKTRAAPLADNEGMIALSGTLAPNGAVLKKAAASADLIRFEGRAVVFDDLEDLTNRIDSEDLDVKADDVIVLKHAGPKGAPGMPEAGYIPIPMKLARQGVKDMLRISDARMSGTAFGTIVLHVSPESADGGPLALVENGDVIRLDAEARTLDLLVADQEMEARRARYTPRPPHAGSERGYMKLYMDTVTQAEDGCDFDFLMKADQKNQ
ncbi:MAG: IlvD/Edd family dehydratase [Rhodospirillales bacterium]